MTVAEIYAARRELRQDDPEYVKKSLVLIRAEREALGKPEPDPLYDELAKFGVPVVPIVEKLRAKGLRVPEFQTYRRSA